MKGLMNDYQKAATLHTARGIFRFPTDHIHVVFTRQFMFYLLHKVYVIDLKKLCKMNIVKLVKC